MVLYFLLLLSSMAGGMIFYDPYHKYNPYESAVYAAFHRTAWSLGTIGVLIGTSYGAFPLLQRFLSWKPFVPLSKLTYAVYLVHFQYQLRDIASSPSPANLGYFEMV